MKARIIVAIDAESAGGGQAETLAGILSMVDSRVQQITQGYSLGATIKSVRIVQGIVMPDDPKPVMPPVVVPQHFTKE